MTHQANNLVIKIPPLEYIFSGGIFMSEGFLKKDIGSKKSIYIKGGILGFFSTIAVMLIFTVALLVFDIERSYAVPFATISVSFGSFIASYFTAKKIGDKGYFIGIIIGLIVFVTITVLSLVLGNSLSLNTLFHFIIILLSSIAGGIIGVNYKKDKKYI